MRVFRDAVCRLQNILSQNRNEHRVARNVASGTFRLGAMSELVLMRFKADIGESNIAGCSWK